MCRHWIFIKVNLVCVNCAFCKLYLEGSVCKLVSRLVEANVSVVTNAQKLNINATCSVDFIVIAFAFCVAIFSVAVKEMNVFFKNVKTIEKLLMHKCIVAVFIILRKVAIFVKVVCFYILKRNTAFFIS